MTECTPDILYLVHADHFLSGPPNVEIGSHRQLSVQGGGRRGPYHFGKFSFTGMESGLYHFRKSDVTKYSAARSGPDQRPAQAERPWRARAGRGRRARRGGVPWPAWGPVAALVPGMLGSYCARRSGSGAHPGRFPLRADARLPMALLAVCMAGGPGCVGTVEGGKDAPAAPRVWQYISLPRGAPSDRRRVP